MKIRTGFVSNSSSASFIVTFESNLAVERIASMIRTSDKWIDEFWNDCDRMEDDLIAVIKRVKNPKKKKVHHIGKSRQLIQTGNKFTFSVDTIMFNDWTDVPAWKFIRALYEKRIIDIKLVEIIQTEDEMDTISKKVKFNRKRWNIKWAENSEKTGGGLSKKEIKEAFDQQEEADMEFLEYLHVIGQKLRENDLHKLAKWQLNR